FFFSSRRRHTRFSRDWSSDVCSSDLAPPSEGDVLATVVGGTVEGRPLTMEEQIAVVTVLFLAGLDTTRGALGNIAAQLAQRPERSEERRVGKEGSSRRRTQPGTTSTA